MNKLIDDNFQFERKQYLYMTTLTPKDRMPQSYEAKDNKFIANNIQLWCSGFYPGTLWHIFEETKDENIRKESERALHVKEPDQTNTGNLVLGFMMFCSFGNAYRITRNLEYKKIIFNSAQSHVKWEK